MTSRQLKQQIENYYKNTGYNTDDLRKYLIGLSKKGYDTSFDESMLSVKFDNLLVIVNTSHVDFYIAKEI